MYDFSLRSIEDTFSTFLKIIVQMRCAPDDLWDTLLDDDDDMVLRDMEARAGGTPAAWTASAITKAMGEWKAARVRWESVKCTASVEASPDFKAGRGPRQHRHSIGRVAKCVLPVVQRRRPN